MEVGKFGDELLRNASNEDRRPRDVVVASTTRRRRGTKELPETKRSADGRAEESSIEREPERRTSDSIYVEIALARPITRNFREMCFYIGDTCTCTLLCVHIYLYVRSRENVSLCDLDRCSLRVRYVCVAVCI